MFEKLSVEDNPRSKRDHAIFSLLFEIGVSVGALVDLDMVDFNQRTGKLRVTKTSGQQVWLSIPQSVPLIQEYLERGRPELTQSPAESALFVSQMGGRISRQGVWQMLVNRGKKAKIKTTAVRQGHSPHSYPAYAE